MNVDIAHYVAKFSIILVSNRIIDSNVIESSSALVTTGKEIEQTTSNLSPENFNMGKKTLALFHIGILLSMLALWTGFCLASGLSWPRIVHAARPS